MSGEALIRLRYPATCVSCRQELMSGTRARWDRSARQATCPACLSDPCATEMDIASFEINRGEPGASARREWERRHERREAQVRSRHKHVGGLLLALSDDPQSTRAWGRGARGEQTIGANLELFRNEGFAVLHDRRIPGTKANIDHLVISPAGVFVIDTKNYSERVEQRDLGGWFKPDLRLYVGGRDRTKLVSGMARQVEKVRSVLATRHEWKDFPVTPTILFIGNDNWTLLAMRPLRFGSVQALWGKALGKLICADGRITRENVPELERALAIALPAAA
jgi:hypothetical protein